jgi:hypothetical protein
MKASIEQDAGLSLGFQPHPVKAGRKLKGALKHTRLAMISASRRCKLRKEILETGDPHDEIP